MRNLGCGLRNLDRFLTIHNGESFGNPQPNAAETSDGEFSHDWVAFATGSLLPKESFVGHDSVSVCTIQTVQGVPILQIDFALQNQVIVVLAGRLEMAVFPQAV